MIILITVTVTPLNSQPLNDGRPVPVGGLREIVLPVPKHVVDGDRAGRRVDVAGPVGRVSKGEAVAAAGGEVAGRARVRVPRGAALAERRELPVGRV